MYTPTRNIERWQSSTSPSPRTTRLPQIPKYHVYSHYGCRSEDIDRCGLCKYLVQPNTYLHTNPQSLVAATSRLVLPEIRRQLLPTPIKPVHRRIDEKNDLYLLHKIPGSPQTRREAEDAAIINICLKDRSIDRIVLVDAEEEEDAEEDHVLSVTLYDLEKPS